MPSQEKLKMQCDEILEIFLEKGEAYKNPNSKKNDTYRDQSLKIDSASTYILSKTTMNHNVTMLVESFGRIIKENYNSSLAGDFVLQYPDSSCSYILSSVISFTNEEITKIIQGKSRDLKGNVDNARQKRSIA